MAPAPAPAMDVEDGGGGGAKNQNNVLVVKSDNVSTGGFKDGGALVVPGSKPAGGHPVVAPESLKYEGGDTTECSSSFGDTCSGFDDEADGGEPEVNSHISAPADGGPASRPPRRKKVTAEWRNAVRPILWRCQWLELRMKDLSSQVSKYDRELALVKKEKELQQAVSKRNGSMPEPTQICKGHGNSSMKRRKRKRHEDTSDTSLYINKHQILSYYYDKQNKEAEADDLLTDDDCSSPVDGGIRGGLDTVTLLDAEEYDMIFEQLTLRDILLTIDGVQSQVHLLQDRVSKAHSEEEKLAFPENNTHVRLPRKRQNTQKRSFSYTKCRYSKPQKKKNLNILLKDDDGPAFAARPALSDKETDGLLKDASGNAEEKSGEWNHSLDKAITVDLLLGVDSSLPNGHLGDLCKENTDDILIDNQAANEGCQQFEKVKRLLSETSSKGYTSAPVETKSTSAPVKVDGTSPPLEVESTSAPVVKQETFLEKSTMMKPAYPGKKQRQKSKNKKKGGGSAWSIKKQSKEATKIPVAKQKTESMSSAAEEMEFMTPLSAWKKCKTGKSSLASKKQKTGKSSSAANKWKTENSSSAAKQETENSSSAAKKQEAESTPSKLKIEKAVLVAVNSRRSQRVRKPKVFTE